MKVKLTIDNSFYKLKVGDKVPLLNPDILYKILEITLLEDGRSKVVAEKQKIK